MTYPSVYYVDRITGTPADTLLAFGLADLISRIVPEDVDWGLTIQSTDNGYKITLKDNIPAEWVDNRPFDFQLDAIGVKRKDKKTGEKALVKMPSGLRFIDYDEEKKRKDTYREQKNKGISPEDLAKEGILPPHPAWQYWAIINQLSAVDTYNKVVKLWYQHKQCFPELLCIILDIFKTQPNQMEQAIESWKQLANSNEINEEPTVSALQVINPSMVEGGNNSKSLWRALRGLDSFWLVEYLKFVGFYRASIPRVVGSGEKKSSANKSLEKKLQGSGPKERRTYVLHPLNLTWATHKELFPKFQKALSASTAIKMDILAVLSYCRVFVEQWRDGQLSGRFAQMVNGQPGDHVLGIEGITYRSLGKAYTPLNINTLALPKWLPQVESREQAVLYLGLLREHTKIIYTLDEGKKGDETELLHHYRSFLSSGDLKHFFRFTLGYSHILMNRIKAKAYSPQYTISNLEVLLMAHDKKLSEILEKRGFQRIASAIRQSTVIPQRAKANRGSPDRRGPDNPYEVRYGLGAELMRQAAYPEKFVLALSRFLFAFRQENVQVFERFKGAPPIHRIEITEDDINQVVALIDDDQYSSETVASLLVACGYASKGRPLEDVALSSGEDDVSEAEFDSESHDESEDE